MRSLAAGTRGHYHTHSMTTKPYTLREIADLIGAKLEGDPSREVRGLASIEEASAKDITFVADARRAGKLAQSAAAAVIVGNDFAGQAANLLRVANVQQAIAALLAAFLPSEDLPPTGVHALAVIAPSADIAPDACIGPGVVVGERAVVGAGSVLCANVSVGADVAIGKTTVFFEGVVVRWGCRIGDNVRIGPNSVIGYEGFGYYFAGGRHNRIPHIGSVVIENDVELGACTCVDRAKFGVTRIGQGTKIDNQVHVAHNVQVGRNCIMAAQVGIAGSTKLEDLVILGGGAGLRDNITLGKGVQCGAFSAVASDVEAGQVVAGIPAGPARDKFREIKALAALPDLMKQVRDLQTRLEALESPKDH